MILTYACSQQQIQRENYHNATCVIHYVFFLHLDYENRIDEHKEANKQSIKHKKRVWLYDRASR